MQRELKVVNDVHYYFAIILKISLFDYYIKSHSLLPNLFMLDSATPELADRDLFLGRHWKTKALILLIALLLVFNVALNLDKFRLFIGFYWIVIGKPNPNYCCYYWQDFAYQTTDWLMQKLVVYSQTHVASMRFRILPPLIYAVFRSPLSMYLFQVVLGIGYLYMVLDEAYRILGKRQLAFLFAAGFVGLYEGAAFVLDVAGFGDAFAFPLMMGALYFRKTGLIFLCMFLASWVDERAIFNSSLIITYHWLAPYRVDRPTHFDSLSSYRPTPQMLAVFVGAALYMVIRLYLTSRFDLIFPKGGDTLFFNLRNAFKTVGFRSQVSYEGFWLLLIAMFVVLWQRRQRTLLGILGALTAVTTFTVLMQGDFIRTISFGFPLLFIALIIVNQGISRRDLFWILFAVSLVSLLQPIPYQ